MYFAAPPEPPDPPWYPPIEGPAGYMEGVELDEEELEAARLAYREATRRLKWAHKIQARKLRRQASR